MPVQIRFIETFLVISTALCMSTSALARKPVSSLLELRQRHVVMQEWDLSCGAAALTTLLNFQHGLNLTEREVAIELINRQEYRDNPELLKIKQGFSLLDLKMYVEKQNLEGRGLGQLSLENLIEMAPVLVPVSFLGYNHFVIFRGVAKNRVLLADPAWGNRTLLKDQFLNAWINFRTIGKVGFVVSSKPQQSLPAKAERTVPKTDSAPSTGAIPKPVDMPAIDQAHEVQRGETLWRIAKLTTGNATNWRILAEVNNLNSDVRILPGQQLTIPHDLVLPKLEQRLATVNKEAVFNAKIDRADHKVVFPANTAKDRDTIAKFTEFSTTTPNQSSKLHSFGPTKTSIAAETSVNAPKAIGSKQFEQTDTDSPKNLLSPSELDFMMLL